MKVPSADPPVMTSALKELPEGAPDLRQHVRRSHGATVLVERLPVALPGQGAGPEGGHHCWACAGLAGRDSQHTITIPKNEGVSLGKQGLTHRFYYLRKDH